MKTNTLFYFVICLCILKQAVSEPTKCWVQSQGRKWVEPICPSVFTLQDGKCYATCSAGFTEQGNLCLQTCPEGFRSDGPHCLKPASVSRIIWHPPKPKCSKTVKTN